MLTIQNRPTEKLIPYARNSRTHTEAQIKQIISSIKEFGWTNPILIDENDCVIAGHARLEAAKRLGYEDLPCISLQGLSDSQKEAYVIADNKLALNAGWNEEMLAAELRQLRESDYDLALTGFDASELAMLLERPEEQISEAAGDSILPAGANNVLVHLSFPASVWLGKREEIFQVLDRMEKLYLCQKSVKE